MKLEFTSELPSGFDAESRVWIYQCSRPFSINETVQAKEMLQQFAAGWKSHGAEVKGYASIFFNQFVIVLADETAAGVSGCSTDSSVRVIKEIEQKFGVQLFDRQSLAFFIKEQIQLLPLSQLGYAVENNFINADTLYFNNIVQTKAELLSQWIIPVKDSWVARRISFAEVVK